jgi:DNA invertase Pin-like site-specific DNA recombinase
MKILRCAIYTRKSSEEGLDQSFNSLHAQREACSAYILSQAGEGWSQNAEVYDDGGYSGGSMDRPGLKALMADIGKGQIDVVVVYKVDRLTRSLADFARIVELFDAKGISFVSITQAFNTTTSMGRLTLNVLLSFAQFEREVTGERIRDKIAASKKKGLWMGGRPPLGYDGVDRKLVINPAEAAKVRDIFLRFLAAPSVMALANNLEAAGVQSKSWLGRKGQMLGGGPLGKGALYHLLANEVYRGGIRHREHVYPDCHPAIIDLALWEAVQARLRSGSLDQPTSPKLDAPVLLEGLLFDPRNVPMVAVHANRRGRRYRYYVARDLQRGAGVRSLRMSRIAMGVIDEFILAEASPRLRQDFLPDQTPAERVRAALTAVRLTEDSVQICIRHEAVSSRNCDLPGRSVDHADGVEITIPIALKHRQGAAIIEAPQSCSVADHIDRALVRAVALARSWSERLAAGDASSMKDLARSEGYCTHYAAKLLTLAWLAPDLVEKIVEGRQPRALSLGALIKEPLPLNWDDQRALVARCGLRSS